MNGVERSNDGVKLLNCPFCGGKAFIRQNKDAMKTYSAYCGNEDCSASPKVSAYGKEMAIGLWNTRKPAEEAINAWNTRKPIDRAIERLEEDITENPEASLGNYRAGLYKAIEILKEEVTK